MLPLGIRATNFAQHLRGAGASQATTLNAARSQKNPYAVQPLSTARTLPVTALVRSDARTIAASTLHLQERTR